MANDDKTEEPSAHKLSEARKKGNIFQSKELSTVVILFSAFLAVHVWLPTMRTYVQDYMHRTFTSLLAERPFDEPIFARFGLTIFLTSGPILLTVLVISILIHGIQTKFIHVFPKPSFNKLNPINGIKRLFSVKNLVQLLMAIAKITILIYFVYTTINKQLLTIASMVNLPVESSYQTLMQMIWDMCLKLMGIFFVLGVVDWAYQKRQYHNDMKMTKQEVKDEYKQMEGNPEIKGRIKRMMREKAQQRMMQAVPEADVVVRNPDHFAVALKYDPDKNGAPYVLAKGQDYLALKIVEIADLHAVPMIENVPLARGLYAACDVDQEIPPEFYGAVAEILVYIFRQEGRQDKLLSK